MTSEGSAGAGRYAPSPSGELHLGNLRTAMLAWLFARSTGRAFLMRVEDLDRARDAGAAEAQLAELRALGLEWDGRAVRQSERIELYRSALARLDAAGLVYECTCARREILDAVRAPHAPPGSYPGTCRDRTPRERAAARDAISPRLPALRLRTPSGAEELGFEDLLMGRVSGWADDLVLRRGDGVFAYNLAVVVDDAEMGVDQIVRGDDLAPSTARQIVLQRLLGLPSPPRVSYAHVPLVLGPNGARLAKRDGAVTLSDLAERGVAPDEVRSRLAVSLGMAEPGETITMPQLLGRFDPARIPLEPWTWCDAPDDGSALQRPDHP
ncbi:tRNA glutamyl-Q(34) synthetase GluQRS [Leucobacter weissii]|uniref:Glutamyl-Q tRNA(Asp) synthetase n=1 Tax=Leucobacter weissii TaxID=1983706 RepID=A0A939S8V9_9MICO|nr:tRNA glutamyl-Q(34) synthetase GluQRS [Leucobacter weissii]MBO1902516.1 tRNA glutamyl-Q(34) synthetase GluQRS [Leucobacter weissii]